MGWRACTGNPWGERRTVSTRRRLAVFCGIALRMGGSSPYPLRPAGPDVVRQAGHVVRVAHEDGSLDGREGVSAEGGT